MDAREAVKQALRTHQATLHLAVDMPAELESDEPIGEFEVAEYIIFCLALETYISYVQEAAEAAGEEGADPDDPVIRKGIKVLRQVDAELDRIRGFLNDNLPDANKRLMMRALRAKATTPRSAGMRAVRLRTAINRGGAKTMRAVFHNMRPLRLVREGMSAQMMEDRDAALDKLAAIPIKNPRIRAWIDLAAKTAGAGELPQNPVENAATDASDTAVQLMTSSLQEVAASTADDAQVARDAREDKLVEVEMEAKSAARQALDAANEPDVPMTKSEVIGVATAAAVAASSDPSDPSNVPQPLRDLDDEQRAAALTDGRVLVAAGAGAGKSTTLVARIAYLVKDRRVDPSRIMACSFNKAAADELGEKIAKKVGDSFANNMKVGTLNALFLRSIHKYGTPEEREAMQANPKQVSAVVSKTVQRMWEECFDKETNPKPKAGDMRLLMTQWSGNNVSVEDAKAIALTKKEAKAALWYEMYEGLKGNIPGWEPPCEDRARRATEAEYEEKYRKWERRGRRGRPPKKYGTTFERFMNDHRTKSEGGQTRTVRIGDFTDQIRIFRDILRRNPGVRKQVQAQFDHIMVDECQDLNETQHEVIELMTEHVTEDNGKSLWMVGDDKQSIYGFRGARPDLFTGLDGKEGWKTRSIKTNYRCEPEIVAAGNALIAHNEGQIPMEARANPAKGSGNASIVVDQPEDQQAAAIQTLKAIKMSIDNGGHPGDHAVLARTNNELNAYEAACLINGIPFVKRGAGSFLESLDVKAVLGYTELVAGEDPEAMQDALASIVNSPRRFWRSTPEQSEKNVKDALKEYAKRQGIDYKTLNPMEALRDYQFQELLTSKFTNARGYAFDKAVERVQELAGFLDEMQANASSPDFATEDLFNEILMLKGQVMETDPDTGRKVFAERTFRESIQNYMKDSSSAEPEDEAEGAGEEDEKDENEGLGNISFLFQLAEANPEDPDEVEERPETPTGYLKKMNRIRERADELRVTPRDYAAFTPEKKKQYVYLGTAHSVKGLEWPNVFVNMPANKFPMPAWDDEEEEYEGVEGVPDYSGPVPKALEDLTPEQQEMRKRLEDEQLEQERRLAYVAITRAATNLKILSPRRMPGKKGTIGVSMFVSEAGLQPGENVQSEMQTPEDPENPPDSPGAAAGVPRTASTVLNERRLYAHLEPPPDIEEYAYELDEATPWNPDDFKGEG